GGPCTFDSSAGLSLALGSRLTTISISDFLAGYSLDNVGVIITPSDFGGTLTQDAVDALNARKSDVESYIDAGGGMVVLSEQAQTYPNLYNHVTEDTIYSFLPFAFGHNALDQYEDGFQVTAYGHSIGVLDSDVNVPSGTGIFGPLFANYSHEWYDPTIAGY